MKLKLVCSICTREEKVQNLRETYVEVKEGSYYKIVCHKGHETTVFIQEQQFEILFEMGAMALLDGYPREAVSSFASSLERFYEYVIELILAHKGISDKEYEATWSMMSKQSERQYGAFLALYLLQFGTSPIRFEQKKIEFRNNVIHKGYIPTYDEVLSYGDYILQYISKVAKQLVDSDFTQANLTLLARRRYSGSFSESDLIVQTSVPTILRLSTPFTLGEKTLSEVLKEREGFQVLRGSFQ